MATRRDGLTRATIAALLKAGVQEQRDAIQRRQVDSARQVLNSRSHQDRLRALRALEKLKWIDRRFLPLSKPVAALMARLRQPLDQAQMLRARIPPRTAARPVTFPFLHPTMIAAVRRGESPAAVARFCVERILPAIPYVDVPDHPADRTLFARELADRIRIRKKTKKPAT